MLASRVGKKVDYVPLRDREKRSEEQTTFILKTLDARAKARVTDHLVGMDEEGNTQLAEPGSGFLAACAEGVDGWRNLPDHDGHQVPCLKRRVGTHEVLTEASLNAMSEVIPEIGAEIMLMNALSDEPGEGRPTGESSSSSPTSPATEPASPAT